MLVIVINVIALTFLIATAQSLEPMKEVQDDVFSKIIELLSKKSKGSRRTVEVEKSSKLRSLLNKPKTDAKPILRMPSLSLDSNGEYKIHPDDKLAEEELKYALLNRKPALMDRPIVESNGKHDFLVLNPMFEDRHVTVIPNAIYMNIEKKCVNWLDDCSLKGIRARLLRGNRSPFR